MKKIFIVVFFTVIAGFCFAVDPAEGYWISVDEKTNKVTAGWEIYIQSGKLYGKILSVAGQAQDLKADQCKGPYKGFPVPGDTAQMTVVGTPWIYGLVQDGAAGQWKGGNIVDPNDGSLYGCKITFHTADGKKYRVDTLEMRGTIGPFGRSQFWRKSTQSEASGLR